MTGTYASLHTHSMYSLLDGCSRPQEIAGRCRELGIPAVALTDHGRMSGLVAFEKACREAGVKPLLGMEAYCCGIGRDRTERVDYTSMTRRDKGTPDYEKTNYHLVLIAKNRQGYDNLCRLTTESYASGFYYRPRIDYRLLEEFGEGLIVTSACCMGEVSSRLYNRDYARAVEVASWFKGRFGDDYYLEVMNHGLPFELEVMRNIRNLADELGVKTVVTNDSHYTYRGDSKLQKTMMLLNMHKSWADSDVSGSFFDGVDDRQGEVEDSGGDGDSDPIFETSSELYIKSYEEMVAANVVNGGEGGRVERELANTLEIADKCDFEIDFIDPEDTDSYILPTYDVKTDVRSGEYEGSGYEVPAYIVDACLKELHEEGFDDVRELSDYLNEQEMEALRFLSWLCEDGLARRVLPKVEAGGRPLPDEAWIRNKPAGLEVVHTGDSPDETWLRRLMARGETPETVMAMYRERLAYEMGVVVAKRFVNYFLIVQSYISYVRSRGEEVGPGRGCLLPDEPVLTDRGLVPIGMVRAGEHVVYDDAGEPCPVARTFEYDVDEDVVEVSPAHARPLRCTADHRVEAWPTLESAMAGEPAGWVPARWLHGMWVTLPAVRRPRLRKLVSMASVPGAVVVGDSVACGYEHGVRRSSVTPMAADVASEDALYAIGAAAVGGSVGERGEVRVEMASREGVERLIRRLSASGVGEVDEVSGTTAVIAGPQATLALSLARPGSRETPAWAMHGDASQMAALARGMADAACVVSPDGSLEASLPEPLAAGLEAALLMAAVPAVRSGGVVRVGPNDALCEPGMAGSLPADAVVHGRGGDAFMRVGEVRPFRYRGKVHDLSVETANHHSFATASCHVSNSGAGSLLNYLAGITGVDPLPNGLLFFRFLNKDRKGYPDIDVDFSAHGRDDILWPHLREQYGMDNTSMVAAYSYWWGKSAIKSAASVLFDTSRDPAATPDERAEGKRTSVRLSTDLCDLIDNRPNLDLRDELTDDADADGRPLGNVRLKELIATDPRYGRIIELALRLQGLIRGESQHASAYIMSPHPIVDRLPLQVGKDERAASQRSGEPVTDYVIQYDGREIQDQLGYVKFDLLCINDLEVITRTVETIRRVYGAEIDIDSIPMDSKVTFKMLQQGKVSGVFQFDGSPVPRRLLVESGASSIGDLSIITALDRPGALGVGMDKAFVERKRDPSRIEYFSPAAEDILQDTYGLACFQESLMMLSESPEVVGFTPGEADTMRKILAHKDKSKIDRLIAQARERAAGNGVPQEVIDAFCEMAVASGSYSFNRSHSLAYATIAYRGAFLKTYFPDCFLASVSQVKPKMKDKDKIPDYLGEARQLGVTIRPPHVNWSQEGFSVPEPHVIAYGLNRIKGVGARAAEAIIAERESGGPYTDVTDFMARVPTEVNRAVISRLIDAGALDGLGWTRRAMAEGLDFLANFHKDEARRRRDAGGGQLTLDIPGDVALISADGPCGTAPDEASWYADGRPHNPHGVVLVPGTRDEYPEFRMLAAERETFGMYLDRSVEDYSVVGKFAADRAMREAQAEARRAGRAPERTLTTVGDALSLPDGTKVELTAYVADVTDKYTGRRGYRTFKSGKGATVFLTDYGRGYEGRYGFSPTRHSARATCFERVWRDMPRPAPGAAVEVCGRVSRREGFPPTIAVDEWRQIPYDADAYSSDRDGYARDRAELEEAARRAHDPRSEAYMVPKLVFPDAAARDAFLEDEATRTRLADPDGYVIATYEGNPADDDECVFPLRQTRGMVRHAREMSPAVRVGKRRLPAAECEIARNFDLASPAGGEGGPDA